MAKPAKSKQPPWIQGCMKRSWSSPPFAQKPFLLGHLVELRATSMCMATLGCLGDAGSWGP